jgi:antitoxin HicB
VVDPKEILKQPYARILTPDPDGRVTAEIMEFPGCVAFGDNAADALARLEGVAAEWIAAAVEQGQDIPEPMDSADFSGRLVLRMSKGLHKRAALCAERESVSLNSFIVTHLAEAVGERARRAPVQFQTFGIQGTNVVFVQGGFLSQLGGTSPIAVTGAHYGVAGEWNVGAPSFGVVTGIQLLPVWERRHA